MIAEVNVPSCDIGLPRETSSMKVTRRTNALCLWFVYPNLWSFYGGPNLRPSLTRRMPEHAERLRGRKKWSVKVDWIKPNAHTLYLPTSGLYKTQLSEECKARAGLKKYIYNSGNGADRKKIDRCAARVGRYKSFSATRQQLNLPNIMKKGTHPRAARGQRSSRKYPQIKLYTHSLWKCSRDKRLCEKTIEIFDKSLSL